MCIAQPDFIYHLYKTVLKEGKRKKEVSFFERKQTILKSPSHGRRMCMMWLGNFTTETTVFYNK